MPPPDYHNGTQLRKWNEFDQLIVDLPCHQCKYNLRGLQRKGLCPECGTVILVSVHKFASAPVPEHSEPPVEIVAGIIVISTRWFLTGISAILFLIASLLVTFLNESGIAVVSAVALYFLSTIIFLVGQTARERRLGPRPKRKGKAAPESPDKPDAPDSADDSNDPDAPDSQDGSKEPSKFQQRDTV